MKGTAKPKVLFVDDERYLLEGIADNLRTECNVIPASTGSEALRILAADPDIAAIVCDMRMPAMDGATVLSRAREISPDVPRILLTGQADLASAITAINQGQLFRFLTKPCPREALIAVLRAAVDLHRRLAAEKILLEQTLRGSIAALVDILALANPVVFGRANRVKSRVVALADLLTMNPRWQVETAALLQPIGSVTLTPETAEHLRTGARLSEDEQKMVARLPRVTDDLLAHIPRLEDVRAILAMAAKPVPTKDPLVELGGAVLRIANQLDDLEVQGKSAHEALDVLRGDTPGYPIKVLDAAARLAGTYGNGAEIRKVTLRALTVGMTFVDDVKLVTGGLLVARGYQVTHGFLERVRNFPDGRVCEPLRVTLP